MRGHWHDQRNELSDMAFDPDEKTHAAARKAGDPRGFTPRLELKILALYDGGHLQCGRGLRRFSGIRRFFSVVFGRY